MNLSVTTTVWSILTTLLIISLTTAGPIDLKKANSKTTNQKTEALGSTQSQAGIIMPNHNHGYLTVDASSLILSEILKENPILPPSVNFPERIEKRAPSPQHGYPDHRHTTTVDPLIDFTPKMVIPAPASEDSYEEHYREGENEILKLVELYGYGHAVDILAGQLAIQLRKEPTPEERQHIRESVITAVTDYHLFLESLDRSTTPKVNMTTTTATSATTTSVPTKTPVPGALKHQNTSSTHPVTPTTHPTPKGVTKKTTPHPPVLTTTHHTTPALTTTHHTTQAPTTHKTTPHSKPSTKPTGKTLPTTHSKTTAPPKGKPTIPTTQHVTTAVPPKTAITKQAPHLPSKTSAVPVLTTTHTPPLHKTVAPPVTINTTHSTTAPVSIKTTHNTRAPLTIKTTASSHAPLKTSTTTHPTTTTRITTQSTTTPPTTPSILTTEVPPELSSAEVFIPQSAETESPETAPNVSEPEISTPEPPFIDEPMDSPDLEFPDHFSTTEKIYNLDQETAALSQQLNYSTHLPQVAIQQESLDASDDNLTPDVSLPETQSTDLVPLDTTSMTSTTMAPKNETTKTVYKCPTFDDFVATAAKLWDRLLEASGFGKSFDLVVEAWVESLRSLGSCFLSIAGDIYNYFIKLLNSENNSSAGVGANHTNATSK